MEWSEIATVLAVAASFYAAWTQYQAKSRALSTTEFDTGFQKADELHARYEARAKELETSFEDRDRRREQYYEGKMREMEAHYEERLRAFKLEAEAEIAELRAEVQGLERRLAPHEKVGIAVVSVDYVYLWVNEVAARLNHPDSTPEDHRGMHIQELWPNLWPEARPHLEKALAGEEVEGVLVANMDGHDRRFRFAYSPIRWKSKGAVVGILALFTLLEDLPA